MYMLPYLFVPDYFGAKTVQSSLLNTPPPFPQATHSTALQVPQPHVLLSNNARTNIFEI